MARPVPAWGLLLLVFGLTGCWHTYHARQFQELPASDYFYGGSFLWEPWEYYGSDAGYHYVQYAYSRGSWVRSLELRFPANQVHLLWQRVVPLQRDPVCALEPVLAEKKLTAFIWKPWRNVDSVVTPLPIDDSGRSKAAYFLKPLELKLAPPPKLEDFTRQP